MSAGVSSYFEGIYDKFCDVVRRWPHAAAIVQGDRQPWTYADLLRAADNVAVHLHRLGVTRGDRVAISAPSGMETIAAFIGILKSGAVFVPLDPCYPDQQLEFLLRDAAPAVVIAKEESVTRFQALRRAGAFLSLEEATNGAFSAIECAASKVEVLGDDAASIMYTSGSTGRPKGVLVPHRAILRLVTNPDYCALLPDEVLLQLSPLAFDASTFEIWGALLNGGKLAIVDAEHPSILEIASAIKKHGVTTAWLTAGLFHLMADHAIEALRPLRQLLAGGDVLSMPHVRKAQEYLPDCRIINGYGPTENTTFTSCYTFPRGGAATAAAPIGSPINGTSIFVVDDALKPVRQGETGQLAACGDGLALGYLNQPELTSEKFVTLPPPISKRAYLTGDLVRQRADGVLEFHGRNDRQVKISGKRVELGEIEFALRSDSEVEDAAAIVTQTNPDLKSIVAAIVPRQKPPSTEFAADLQARLETTLPAHMIPSRMLILNALPLTANGKVDRAALDVQAAQEREPLVASMPASAAGSVEEGLSRLWASVLGLPSVGLRQNFFDLGGRSLQLMRLHAEIQQMIGREFPLPAMFEHNTVSDLARYLRGQETSPATAAAARERAMRGRAAAERFKRKIEAERR